MTSVIRLTVLLAILVLGVTWSVRGQVPGPVVGPVPATSVDMSIADLVPELPTDPNDPPGYFKVVTRELNPAGTRLVQAEWLWGIGCPTNVTYAPPNATNTGPGPTAPYTDPACPTGDDSDTVNWGLLLVKSGPTNNFAAAIADLWNVRGLTLTELGYDLRKYTIGSIPGTTGSGPVTSPLGSHCGAIPAAGSPRFNIFTTNPDGTTGAYILSCNFPVPDVQTFGDGWIRLRWGGITGAPMALCIANCPLPAATQPQPVTGTVNRIFLVFGEGQDAAGDPDRFGAAIVDNIDFNGKLVGRKNY